MNIPSQLSGLSQNARLLTLQSPQMPGQDAQLPQTLVVERFTGTEAVNALFRFDIDALSVSTPLDLQAFLGQELTLRLLQADGSQRAWHGYCTQAHWLGSDGGAARYRLRLEPFLAFLRLRRDSYIFQDQTAQQTIHQLLGEHPQANWHWDVAADRLAQHPICTQYRESNLDFMVRILASQGLSYRFEHDQADPGTPGQRSPSSPRAQHQLVIFDPAAQAPAMPGGYSSIRFHRVAATESLDAITTWCPQARVQPNAVTRASWDPARLLATSAQDSSTPLSATPLPVLEQFDGSGERQLTDAAHASRMARLHIQALELPRQTFTGTGAVRQLAAGHRFTLAQHARYVEDGTANAFTVLQVEHAAQNNLHTGMQGIASSFLNSHTDPAQSASGVNSTSTGSSEFDSNDDLAHLPPGTYRNRFSCVRLSTPIVPRATAQRHAPTALGPQTALVVGVAGNGDNAITTERDHRIKIQFPWQRGQAPVAGGLYDCGTPDCADLGNAPGNDTSGTWVRVAEALAGPNWGTQFTPRIGSEVLVNFIEGDMDRPLVVGQLYNGADLPPFSAGVDSGVNHAGVVSGLHSTGLDGSGYNQWVVDDSTSQLRMRLASSTAASQLNLGYLVAQAPSSAQRGSYRGSGFELRTDAWGVVRGGEGVLLSTHARAGQGSSGAHSVTGAQMDAAQSVAQLKAAQQLTQALMDAATHQSALNSSPAQQAHIDLNAAIDPQQLGKHPASVNGQEALKAPPGSRELDAAQPVERFAQPLVLLESPAIAKVLSLEQGQTDRLCEFSPRELLRLVFDVFGDQEVLGHYDTAREHQQQLGREMEQAAHELDHSKAQLAELQNRVSNYQTWQHKVQEHERLATEVVPVLEWHGQRQKLTERSRDQRHHASQNTAQRSSDNAKLLQLLEQRNQGDTHVTQLLQERDAAAVQRDSTRDLERPLEALAKREAELLALVGKESDAEALTADLDTLRTAETSLQSKHSALLQKRELAAQTQYALAGQNTPPFPDDAQRLQAQKIGHRFLAEVVEVRDEHWRAAIEGVLRASRWMVLLEHADDVAGAEAIASTDSYRHYITAPGDTAPQAEADTLLANIRLDAKVPRWLLQQLQHLRCVDSPAAGRKTAGSWITPQAYSFDGRGARSLWVEPRDHQFGAAALIARRDAVERDLRSLDAALGPLGQELRDIRLQIKDCQKSLAGHSAAQELGQRNDEFSAAKQARIAASQHWQSLDTSYTDAKTRHQQTDTQYRQLEHNLRQKNQEADRQAAELLATRKQHTANIDTSNHRRRQIPAAWRAPHVVHALVRTYQNDTQARLRLQSVHEELQLDTWEKDATVEERFRRMEVLVREQGYSLGDHQAKNAQAGIAVHNARESYIEVLRSTVRRYRKNIQELGELAGVAVNADLPVLENNDTMLAQAGLKVHFNFDGKGSIGLNDGEASGGQQVIKSLILLVALLKDDETASGGFVFIDEPFAHLDVRNIQLVGHFLRSTQAQYVLTTPITHNLEVFEPAEITLITSKKPKNAKWAPPIAVAKRRSAPVPV